MPLERLSIPALRIRQPIGDFFVAVMNAAELVSVSYAHVRELEENALDTYMGINRRLSMSRVKELQSYVNTYDATFPTAVILAVESANTEYDEKKGVLHLIEIENDSLGTIAKIIARPRQTSSQR